MGKNRDHSRFPNAITVLDNGNVGIGTTSPTGLLELSKASSGGLGPILFLRNNTATANNNAVQISMAANSGGDATSPTCKIVLTETSTAAASLSFYLYDGVSTLHERFKIGSDGIVTIKNGKQLVIDSGITGEAGLFIKAEGTNTGSGFTNIQSFYGNVGYISPLVLNRYGGNIGVFTTTPEVDFQIGANTGTPRTLSLRYSSVPAYMSNTWTGTYSKAVLSINYYDNSNGTQSISGFSNVNYAAGSIELRSATSGSDIIFNTNTSVNTAPVERMRISNNGNIGIGTTSPEGPLHIRGAISAGYVGMAIVNYVSVTNTSAGIDFGVDASSAYNGGGNAQIKVTNTNGGDNKSKMDLNIWNGAALVTGINISDAGKVSFPTATAMNYAVSSATAVTVTNNCSPTTVASVTLTTSGKPVLITVSGDNNPLGGPTWCYVMIFRNGSSVGHRVIAESPGNSVNTPFALTHIDTPSAGSNTYTVNVSVCGSYPIIFGETGDVQAPTITVVELL